MPVVVIVNPKGGVGKSTLATNIAGYWASRGHAVALGDLDRQQSSRNWLQFRPAHVPAIMPWNIEDSHKLELPKDATYNVVDTPAGLHGKALKEVLKLADKLLLPLQPSVFDMLATRTLLEELAEYKKIDRLDVALVGMRAKEHTVSLQHLHTFCEGLPFAVLGTLRDTQNYVHLAAQGLTLFDVTPGRVQRDLEQWQPICAWLDAA
ncbi:MAG: ParA family protein [Brachymonas sp.]|nr:ParA family protein [Brachymonas sp.]